MGDVDFEYTKRISGPEICLLITKTLHEMKV